MPILFRCPDCKATLEVDDNQAGAQVACRVCKAITRAPLEAIPIEHVGAAGKAAWADQTSPLGDVLGFVLRLVFFVATPALIVFVCGMMNLGFLMILMLLTLLLTTLIGRPKSLLRYKAWFDKVPFAGKAVADGLETLARLQEFYRQNKPRIFLFYLFYPITAPLACLVSASARKELRLYGGIITAIILLLALEIVVSYWDTYPPYLTISDAFGYVIVRFLFALCVVICFFVPLATTSFAYQLSGKIWRLRLLAALGLLAALPAVFTLDFGGDGQISFASSELLDKRMKNAAFRADLREITEEFLVYRVRKLSGQSHAAVAAQPELTRKYRTRIAKLTPGDEVDAFDVLSFAPAGQSRGWLGVRVHHYLYSNKIHPPTLLCLVGPDGVVYTSWTKVPAEAKARFELIDTSKLESSVATTLGGQLNKIGSPTLIDDR